jgi:hypothetical protein
MSKPGVELRVSSGEEFGGSDSAFLFNAPNKKEKTSDQMDLHGFSSIPVLGKRWL